jgi:hypothetical protein
LSASVGEKDIRLIPPDSLNLTWHKIVFAASLRLKGV